MPSIGKICSYLSPIRCIASITSKEFRTLIVISSVGLAQGLIFSCDVVFSYIYRDDYLLSPTSSSFFDASNQVPWMIKPIWGALSDNFQLFGYKRKSYLIIMAFLCWFSIFNFGTWIPPLVLGFLLLFLSNVALSFANCMAEAVLVQNAQETSRMDNTSEHDKIKAASKGVSFFFGNKYAGKILGSILIMAFLEETHRQKFLFGASFAPLLVVLLSFLLPEGRRNEPKLIQKPAEGIEMAANSAGFESAETLESVDAPKDYKLSNVKKAWTFVKNPIIYKPILLMFLTSFVPQSPQAKFYYYTLALGFESTFMGSLKFVSYIAILIAILVYNRYLRNVNFRRFYSVTALIGCILTLSQLILIFRLNVKLGIPDKVFASFDTFILEMILEFNALPILVLACRICPKDIEATIFAVLMAVCNGGYIISLQFGGLLTYILGITSTNFDNLWVMVLITGVFYLLPLLLLWKIKFESAIQHVEGAEEEKPQEAENKSEHLDISNNFEEKTGKMSQEQSIQHKIYRELVADERLYAFS